MKKKLNNVFVIPMGGFAVFPKESSKPTSHILSVAAQVCVITVLVSSKGIAVAHVDTPNATDSIQKMVDDLKKLGDTKLSAILVGGDNSIFFSSAEIYNPLHEILKTSSIPFKHEHFSSALHKGFDVEVVIKTGDIVVAVTSFENIKKANDNMSEKQKIFFKNRMDKDPRKVQGLQDFGSEFETTDQTKIIISENKNIDEKEILFDPNKKLDVEKQKDKNKREPSDNDDSDDENSKRDESKDSEGNDSSCCLVN